MLLINMASHHRNHPMASTTANNVVRNLFLSILGRAADTSGLGSLASQYDSLISSGSTASNATGTVAASIATSNEARSYVMPIYNLYQTVLSRSPDSTGLVYWEEQLHSHSMTLSQLAQQFISSTEFASRYTGLSGDPLNKSAIASFYTNGLLRSYDPSGYQYWVAMANSDTPLARIASQFAYSNEALGIGMTSAASTRVVNYLVALGTSSNTAASGGVWNSVSEAINGATRAGINTGGTVQSPGTVNVTPSNSFTLTEARDTPVGSAWTAFNGPLVLSSNKIAYVQTLNSTDVLNGTAATLTAQLTGGATIAPTTNGVTSLVVTDLSSITNTLASTINVTYMTGLDTITHTSSLSKGVTFSGFVLPPNTINILNQRQGASTTISSRGLFGVDDSISLNMSGDTNSGIVTIQSAVLNTSGWETINISSTGGGSNLLGLASGNSNSLGTISISGNTNLTIKTIDDQAMASVTSIDASTFTGSLVLGNGLAGGLVSSSISLTIKSGSGNDIAYLNSIALSSKIHIDLGSQSPAIGDKVVFVGSGDLLSSPYLTGVETIEFAQSINNSIGTGLSIVSNRYNLINATGVSRIQLDHDGVTTISAFVDNFNQSLTGLSIDAVGSGSNFSQTFNGITINSIDTSGGNDTDTIDIANNGVTLGVERTLPGIPSAIYYSILMGDISLNKIENIDITIHDTSGDMYGSIYRSTPVNITGLYSDAARTLAAKGDVSLSFLVLNVPLIISADFIGITNGVSASFASLTNGANIILGQGPDSITGGPFNDTITGGNGADSITGGAGADSIILTETVAAADTVQLAAASLAGLAAGAASTAVADTITNFSLTNDVLKVSITMGQTGLSIGFGTGTTNVIAAASVVQHVAATTATSIADATSAIAFDGAFADSTALINAVTTNGTTHNTTLSLHAGGAVNATDNQDYLVVWSDGVNSHVGLLNDADSISNLTFLVADLTYSELVTLTGVTSVAAFAAGNLTFIA